MKLLRKKHMKDFLIFVICIIGACLCGIVSEPLFFSILHDVSDSKELTWDLRILIAGIGIYYLGLWLYFEIASAINLDKYDKFGLQASLDDEASRKFPNARIILTKNYLVYAKKAIHVLPYSDILWMYVGGDNKSIGAVRQEYIIINTHSGKKYKTAAVDEIKYNKEIQNIMDEIHKNNQNILVGFTYENKNKYKQGVKKLWEESNI